MIAHRPLFACVLLLGCGVGGRRADPVTGDPESMGKAALAAVFAEYLCAQSMQWEPKPAADALLRAVLARRQVSETAWERGRASVERHADARAALDAALPVEMERMCPGGVLGVDVASTLRNLVASGAAPPPVSAARGPLPAIGGKGDAAAREEPEDEARKRRAGRVPPSEAPPPAVPVDPKTEPVQQAGTPADPAARGADSPP